MYCELCESVAETSRARFDVCVVVHVGVFRSNLENTLPIFGFFQWGQTLTTK